MRSSPLSLLGMFLLGACATVAVQSSASTGGDDPAADGAEGEPVAPHEPVPKWTVTQAEYAASATAPSGKATVHFLARGDNAFVGMLRMDPGAAVPVHRDTTEEYIHVLAGEGTIVIDGMATGVAAGSTIYMPANAEVSYQNGDAQMVALQVFAGPQPASKYDAWTLN